MQFKKRNIKKSAKFTDAKSKSMQLYGIDPIWKVILKVGTSGIAISFFMGLFTFVDQLMLVNFMPDTTRYCFNNLFYLDGGTNTVFYHMVQFVRDNGGSNIYHIIQQQINTDQDGLQNLANAIANANGLGIYNSADVVRAGVSVMSSLTIIINAIPGLFAVGTSVKYTQALGKGDYKTAVQIWQNAFLGSIIAGFVGFFLLIILIPTVIPTQAVKNQITNSELQMIAAQLQLHTHGFISANDLETFYYVQKGNHFTYYIQIADGLYLNVSNNNILNLATTIKPSDFVHTLSGAKTFTYYLISNNNSSVGSTWNTYFEVVRNYSIQWAEDFMYIMDAGIVLFALSSLFAVVLRSDGAIAMSTIITVVTVSFNIVLDFIFIKIAQIGMDGAACASVIGWFIQGVWFALYMQFSKKTKSTANFSVLKKQEFVFSKQIMFQLILFGLSMLIGNVGFTVTNIILVNQMSYVSESLLPGDGSEYFLSVMGAIMPIVNLFFFMIFGIVRANSPIFAFNYSAKQYKRVQEAYWLNTLLVFALGVLILGLIGFCDPVKFEILSWFKVTKASGSGQLQAASRLMWVWLLQIPIMAFATGGMLIFKATNRIGLAYLVSLLRSIIINVPMIFIFSTIAIHCQDALNSGLTAEQLKQPYDNNAMWFFIDEVPVSGGIFSSIIFTLTTVFIYKYMPYPKRSFKQTWPWKIFFKQPSAKQVNGIIIVD